MRTPRRDEPARVIYANKLWCNTSSPGVGQRVALARALQHTERACFRVRMSAAGGRELSGQPDMHSVCAIDGMNIYVTCTVCVVCLHARLSTDNANNRTNQQICTTVYLICLWWVDYDDDDDDVDMCLCALCVRLSQYPHLFGWGIGGLGSRDEIGRECTLC